MECIKYVLLIFGPTGNILYISESNRKWKTYGERAAGIMATIATTTEMPYSYLMMPNLNGVVVPGKKAILAFLDMRLMMKKPYEGLLACCESLLTLYELEHKDEFLKAAQCFLSICETTKYANLSLPLFRNTLSGLEQKNKSDQVKFSLSSTKSSEASLHGSKQSMKDDLTQNDVSEACIAENLGDESLSAVIVIDPDCQNKYTRTTQHDALYGSQGAPL